MIVDEILKELRAKMEECLKGNALTDYHNFISNCEDISIPHFCKYFNINSKKVLGVERDDIRLNILYTHNDNTSMFIQSISVLDEQWEDYLKTDPHVIRKRRLEKLEQINEAK